MRLKPIVIVRLLRTMIDYRFAGHFAKSFKPHHLNSQMQAVAHQCDFEGIRYGAQEEELLRQACEQLSHAAQDAERYIELLEGMRNCGLERAYEHIMKQSFPHERLAPRR